MYSLGFKKNNIEITQKTLAGVLLFLMFFSPINNLIAEDVIPPAPETIPAETPETETVAEPEPQTTIQTGDATSSTDAITEVNTNKISQETIPEADAENTEEQEEQVLENTPTDNTDQETVLQNEATIENETDTASQTGENEAVNNSEETEIQTGDAYANANVVNLANTNIINSNVFFLLLNNFLSSLDNIDLRFFEDGITQSENTITTCENTNECGGQTTENISINNDANIDNITIVRASTGENKAGGQAGVEINTGDAYAGANVANVANTNVIDSNYLLLSLNQYGDWGGDLVLPNADFFSSLFAQTTNALGQIFATNSANIENQTETEANTGENETTGESSSIKTGNAYAGTNIANMINTNILGGTSVYVAFRIFGTWEGQVFNAPENISWRETASGLELFSEDETGSSGTDPLKNIFINNNANINNNVKVMALTGANKAESADGSANIDTGDAYAGANIVNVANTNIVSSNWIMALVNVFGNWTGNVSFGQPDLWIATQVQGPDLLRRGHEVVFTTTIINKGDAPASDLVFEGLFDAPYLEFDGINPKEKYQIKIPRLNPGEVKELIYKARVSMIGIPYGNSLSAHKISVKALETDANTSDNQDEVNLAIYRPRKLRSNIPETQTVVEQPVLSVSKTNNAGAEPIEFPTKVQYEVVIKNDGGDAYEGTLYDVLQDADGKVLSKNKWELGQIFADEEITITYDANFDAPVKGPVTNYAWVEAYQGGYTGDPTDEYLIVSDEAISTLVIKEKEIPEGEVLGASCGVYIDKFMRQNWKNEKEAVKKLQEFLNKELGISLPVTGYFGPMTLQATKDFQAKYKDEILGPWGVKDPTGIVYKTTVRWINKLECPETLAPLPLLTPWKQS